MQRKGNVALRIPKSGTSAANAVQQSCNCRRKKRTLNPKPNPNIVTVLITPLITTHEPPSV